jgi:hypothetical protein
VLPGAVDDEFFLSHNRPSLAGHVGREQVFGSASDSAPRPVLRPCAEACSDGVEVDVAAGVFEVTLRLDDPRGEAGAEEMAAAAMPPVERQRIRAVEVLDARGQVGLGRVDNGMHVVGHQAVRVALPAVALDRVGEEVHVVLAVAALTHDGSAIHPAGGDVEEPVRKGCAQDSRHVFTVDRAPRERSRCARIVTLFLHRTWLQGRTAGSDPGAWRYAPSRATSVPTRRGCGTNGISSSPAARVP